MHRVCVLICLLVTTTSYGQAPPKAPMAPPAPSFLIEALNHASPTIRLRAAQLLSDEKIEAAPQLVDAVLRSGDLAAVRAGVVLIDRLDHLRRTTRPGEPPRLALTAAERAQVRRLISTVKQPWAEPWRWYLAVYLLDKLDPDSLPELLPEFRAALCADASPMKQYAAVQALYRIGPRGRAAEEELWTLLESRPCFKGLYVTRRVLEDDMIAYTDEIGVYDLSFGLQTEAPRSLGGTSSYVTSDLFVLETLRRIGAPSDRLRGALAHLAGHESQDVRLDVARQLGLLQDAAAKRIAAEVLVGLLNEPASLLRSQLADENEDNREEAMALFLRLGPAAVGTVPALAELLSARENRVRLSAALILGRIGPPAADSLPALRRALRFERLREGEDFQVMVEAIDRITGKAKEVKPKGTKATDGKDESNPAAE